MLTNIKAVALRTVRYSDRASILSAWSPEHGRLSLTVPAGKGKSATRYRALTMPMGLFEAVVDLRNGHSVHTMRDIRGWGPNGVRPDVGADALRSTVAMFTAEVLSVVTREGIPDNALWQLITDTAHMIANARDAALANIPGAFLVRLIYALGVAPESDEYRPGMGLDLTEGVYRTTAPLRGQWLGAEATRILRTYDHACRSYSHLGLMRLPASTRATIVDHALLYLSLHHVSMDNLRSLPVLKAIFAR